MSYPYKKSISIMIGSVLLVVFTLAISSITYVWLKDYTIQTAKEAQNTKIESERYHGYDLITCSKANIDVLKTSFPTIQTHTIVEDFLDTNKIDYYENITVNITVGKIYLANSSTYLYKQHIQINNSLNNNNLTDYQIIVNLTYHPAMYSNFSDIRFYYLNRSDNKEYKVSYYLRQKVDNSWAEFIVKVPFIENNYENESIFAYFSNKSLWYSESNYYETMEIPPVSWWNYTNPFTYSGNDRAKSVAVDKQGNYIVVGKAQRSYSNYYWIITKLYPNGTEAWIYIDDPSGYSDEASAVIVDNDSNYVVAGYEHVGYGDSQWRVTKFYPNGSVMWNYLENPSSRNDRAYSIAVDNESNYIIAGSDESTSSYGDLQWRIVKLYPNGTKMWEYTENPSSDKDIAYSIAVDKEGYYIVAGVYGSSTNKRWRVIKLYPNGTKLWTYTEDPSSSTDELYYIAVDNDNNYILVGYDRIQGISQWRIIKLYPNGTKMWEYTENPSSGYSDKAYYVTIDTDGNYLIAGNYRPSSDNQWRIIKLYPNGTKMWEYTENPSSNDDESYAIAVDNESNYVVVGYDSIPGDNQWRVIKLYPNRSKVWNYTKNYTHYHRDIAYAVTINKEGNYVVVGVDRSSAEEGWRILELYPNGTVKKSYRYNPSLFSGEIAYDVAVDSGNNYVVVGDVRNGFTLLKIGHDGTLSWKYDYGPGIAYGVAVDENDNYIAVGYNKVGSYYEWFIVKFYPNGTEVWNFTEIDPSLYEKAKDVAVDKEGNYVVVGYNYTPGSSYIQWKIIKLYPNGTKVWEYVEDPSSGNDAANGVAVDNDGNYVIVGNDYSPGSSQIRVIKLYPNGTKIWTYTENPSTSVAYSVAVDKDGNYIVAGYDLSSGYRQWRIIKLYPNGTKIWTYTENPSSSNDEPYDVAVDNDNNYVIAGYDGDKEIEWRIIKISERKYTDPEPIVRVGSVVSYGDGGTGGGYYKTSILQTLNLLTFNTTRADKLLNLKFKIDNLPDLIDIFISKDNSSYKKITLDSSNSYSFNTEEQNWKSLYLRLVLNSTSTQDNTPIIDNYIISYEAISNENISVLVFNPTNLNLTINSIMLKDVNTKEMCEMTTTSKNYYIESNSLRRYLVYGCSLKCENNNLKMFISTECGVFEESIEC